MLELRADAADIDGVHTLYEHHAVRIAYAHAGNVPIFVRYPQRRFTARSPGS
jgi:hypothetical protein